MRRLVFLAATALLMTSATAYAQVGMPGIEYSTSIAAGDGGQLYPYDQQDPWLHGQFQRVPAYGGFASFRPYNYRHVFSQTQIAGGWGASHGMPYSQQFWNRYRSSYLQGNLHSSAEPANSAIPAQRTLTESVPMFQTGLETPRYPEDPSVAQDRFLSRDAAVNGRPVHVFPTPVVAQ
jgi:hypothetical protein